MSADEAKSVMIEARVRHGVPRADADIHDVGRPNYGTPHGKLCLDGVITNDQFEAAKWYVGRRMTYLRGVDAPGRPHEAPERASEGDGVTLAEALAEWRKVLRVLQDASTQHRAPVTAAMETLFLREVDVPAMYGDARIGLNALHRAFLVGQRRAA